MSETPTTVLVDYATAAIKTDIATYATSESLIADLPPTQKCVSTSTQGSPSQRPWETRWTSMPPDDSSSQGERRTDSHDE